MQNWLKKEWFLITMTLMIVIASITPDIGRSDGLFHLDKLTGLGVALVFFLHGVGLSPRAIKRGVNNWRLHLYIQAATFIAYPLLWVVIGQGLQAVMPTALAFGFCYLFVLPGTISSSVAMTSAAHGNVPAAIFNASLSSLLGIFITPLLVQTFLGLNGVHIPVLKTIFAITQLLLLPMVLGQLARPLLTTLFSKHKSIVNKIDKIVILMIVLNAFSDSVNGGVWHDFSWWTLTLCFIVCCIILVCMVHAIRLGTKRCQFTLADEIAAVFCGSKKTLAAGVPMAKVIFGHDPKLGMILLPIMIYHPIQIFYCAMLANRYAIQHDEVPTDEAETK